MLQDITGIIELVFRYLFAAAAVYITVRCFISLFAHKFTVPICGHLVSTVTGDVFDLPGKEISVGRHKNCDLVLNYMTISRLHAVLAYRGGAFKLYNTRSRTGVTVNGEETSSGWTLLNGDRVGFGGNEFIYRDAKPSAAKEVKPRFSSPNWLRMFSLLTLLSVIQLSLLLPNDTEHAMIITAVFISFILLMWAYFGFAATVMKIKSFELETIAFMLSGLGLSLVAGIHPENLLNQFIALLIGVMGYCILITLLKYPDLCGVARWLAAAGAVGLLGVTLLVAEPINGALSWIQLGPVSVQPSELVKVAFIFVGAATLEKLQSMRSLTKYLIFAVVCVGELFYMYDFGAALIFFFTFVVVAFLRSGDIRTLLLVCAAALLGGLLIIKFRPYIADRFSNYLHVWDDIYGGGYQQTRVLIYGASGGLFGVGLGNGHLRDVFAASEDLVFGVVCEEYGWITGFLVPSIYTALAAYAVKAARKAVSSFYAIAGAGAAALLLFQTMLNVFGVTDLLPLTGVTLPFVSKGGSSVICCFCLFAFIKSIGYERCEVSRLKLPKGRIKH